MTENTKKFLSNFLPFAVSAALLWVLSKMIDFNEAIRIIKSADLKYIFYALMFFSTINLILIVRWFVFIKALELKVDFVTAVRYYLIGLLGNSILPSSVGGDVIKIVGVCAGSQDKPKVVASVLIDRLSGFAGMVLVATVSFILGFRLISNPSVILLVIGMAVASTGIATVLFNQTAYSFCCQIFGRFPKFKDALMKIHYDLALLKGRQWAGYQAILLSALSQMTLAVTYFLLAKALHQDVNFFYFIIFTPLICVVSSVPSIGGLGVRELGAAYFFGKVGMLESAASSVTFISYLFMVFIGLLGGLYFLLTRPPAKES
ncbi:MAG: flippase-like domain-containing protein [Candidatus Omnitrophica bacterium]|nr:flippase-like domain-containing protein [Candidatus Omnitrophota bacterium]